MKRLLLIILLLSTHFLHAQTYDFKIQPYIVPTVDLSILTATTAYWVLANNVEPDKALHFMFGYFATSAMNRLLQPLDLPKWIKIGTPILVFGGLALFKEFSDSQFDKRDFYARLWNFSNII